MPVYSCKVPNCRSDTRKEGQYEKYPWMRGVTFHSFPSARKEATKRSAWIKMVRKLDLNPTKYDRICSLHFVGGKGPTAEHPIPTLFPYNNWMSAQSVEEMNGICGEKGSVVMGLRASSFLRDCSASTQTDLTLGKFTYSSLKKKYRICCEQDDAMDLQCADDHTDGERNITVSLENVDSKLLENLRDFWKRDILCDVQIKTRDGNLKAHSIILATFSDFLCGALSRIPQTSIRTLHVATEIDSMRKVLSLLYGENLMLDQRSVCGVMKAARMLGVESVAQICEMYMRQRVTSVIWTDRKHFIVTANSSENGTTGTVKEVEIVQDPHVQTIHSQTPDVKVELETDTINPESVDPSVKETPSVVSVEPSSVLDVTLIPAPDSTLYTSSVPVHIKTEPQEEETSNPSSPEEIFITVRRPSNDHEANKNDRFLHTVNEKILAEDDKASVEQLPCLFRKNKMMVPKHKQKSENPKLVASLNGASTSGFDAGKGCNTNKAGCSVAQAKNGNCEHVNQVENDRHSVLETMGTTQCFNGCSKKSDQLEIPKQSNLTENPEDSGSSLYSGYQGGSFHQERNQPEEEGVTSFAEVDDYMHGSDQRKHDVEETAFIAESKGQEKVTEQALWSKERCTEKVGIIIGKPGSQNAESNSRGRRLIHAEKERLKAKTPSLQCLKRASKTFVKTNAVTIKRPRLDLSAEPHGYLENNEPILDSLGDVMSGLLEFSVGQTKPAELSVRKSDHFSVGTEHHGDIEQVPLSTPGISKDGPDSREMGFNDSNKVGNNTDRDAYGETETKTQGKVIKDGYTIRNMKEPVAEGVPEDFFGEYCRVVQEVMDQTDNSTRDCKDIDTTSLPKHSEAVGTNSQQYLQCKFCNFKKKIVNGCFRTFLEHNITVHKKQLSLQCKLCSTVAKLEAGFIRHTLQCHDFHNYLNTVTLIEYSKYMYCGHENCDYKVPIYQYNNKDLCFHRFRKHGIPLPAYVAKKQKQCPHCSYVTLSNTQLQEHIKCHTGERPYMCEECGKSFSQNGGLRNHLKHHHRKERKYKCTKCDYAGATRTQLKIHNRKHTGDRPFKCTVCTYASTTRGNLRVHMKKHHDIQI